MTEKVLRCAIYIRVSTSEQSMHGKSLQAQKEYLEHYAQEHNMSVVGVYADEGKTARKELKKRKAIHALIEDVKQGKIDIIIFWRLDRWFRSLADFYKVQDILDECGVRWISASEPGINMETRDGRLQLNVVLSFGQNEVDTTSERIKFVNEASIRNGRLIYGDANMPLGYKSGIVDGKKCMIKDPETEHMVDDFFRYFKQHQTKQGAIRYMQSTYGINFTYTMLSSMLRSELYKGTYRGYPYCPAYLTEKEWDEIHEISNRNVKRAPSGRVYLFSGLIRCPLCGRRMTVSTSSLIYHKKLGKKQAYCYYRCTNAFINHICTNRYRVSEIQAEKYLLENLAAEYEKYKVKIKSVSEAEKKVRKAKNPEQLYKEMERLNILFQKGRIAFDYYDEEYKRLEEELSTANSAITENTDRDLSDLEALLQTDFKEMYDSLSLENRRAFWRSIIKEIRLNDDCAIKEVDFL